MINAHRHSAFRYKIQNPFVGPLVYIFVLVLALTRAPVTLLWAAEPSTPTPTTAQATPTAEPTSTAPVLPATPTPEPLPADDEPRATSTAPVPNALEQPGTSEPTATPALTATLEPTSTSTAPPGTAHLAVLVSESIVPVGGTASSELFVHIEDVRPGIERLRLLLHFDPQVVLVQDADENTANGTQVALSTFFEGQQIAAENQADNARGEIALTLVQTEGAAVEQTVSWQKVATIVWIGRQAGNSPLTVGEQSRFTAADGRVYPANALHHGTAFARMPGQISGRVRLQGRTEHGNTLVSASLAATRVDRSYTRSDGHFVLTATHGEGFYTLSAYAQGYLSAEGSRPIKLTVGSEIDLGEVTLLGGDINGDNRIDIRDLSYVAYHLGGPDAQSDINGDGEVDILDLTLIAGNFGTIGPTTWPTPD